MSDTLLETRGLGVLLVEVNAVEVADDAGETIDVIFGNSLREVGTVANSVTIHMGALSHVLIPADDVLSPGADGAVDNRCRAWRQVVANPYV